jgi:hypothetical protein
MKEQMKELYVDGPAGHDGHPHAVMMATSWPKRWMVVRAGEVSSLETRFRDADPVYVGQGEMTMDVMRVHRWSRGVLDPQHVRKPSCTRTGRSQP